MRGKQATEEISREMTRAVRPGEEPLRLVPPDPPVTLAELERTHVQNTITWAGGNKTLAARTLGIDRRTLFRKLAKYKGKV